MNKFYFKIEMFKIKTIFLTIGQQIKLKFQKIKKKEKGNGKKKDNT